MCVCVCVCVCVCNHIFLSAVTGMEGFAQLTWVTQPLPSLLTDLPSPQASIPEEEGPAATQGISEETPYFVSPPLSTVTTRVGRSAVLTCVVKHLGNRQVSAEHGGQFVVKLVPVSLPIRKENDMYFL